jgi:hypothetical protein
MDQIPDLCDDAAYSAEIVFKICCAATTRKVPKSQTVDAGFGSRRGNRNPLRRRRAGFRHEAGPV